MCEGQLSVSFSTEPHENGPESFRSDPLPEPMESTHRIRNRLTASEIFPDAQWLISPFNCSLRPRKARYGSLFRITRNTYWASGTNYPGYSLPKIVEGIGDLLGNAQEESKDAVFLRNTQELPGTVPRGRAPVLGARVLVAVTWGWYLHDAADDQRLAP